MKNFSLKFFGLSFALIAASCSEDSTIANNHDSAEALGVHKVTISVPASPNSRVTRSSTMLSFDSWTEFDQTVTSLEDQVDTADDRFLSGTDNMTDDALNAYEEQQGYNVSQPLIDFENSLGFTNSLRKTYNALESSYLAEDVLDDAKDPDLKYMFSEEELSLVNTNQEVMVAGQIYKFSLDGYAIYDSSYNQISSFSTSSTERGSCKTWKSSTSYHEYIPNAKKVKRTVTIRSAPFYCKSKAKIVSYAKRASGWKRWRTRLCVGVQAYHYSPTKCDTYIHSGNSGTKCKRRKSLKKTMTDWNYYSAKNAVSIYGNFQYNGYSSTYVLQW